jgi:hypothetical protein
MCDLAFEVKNSQPYIDVRRTVDHYLLDVHQITVVHHAKIGN